jgi:ornithine cyclodeaminase/alanine dehydrogenase-like protein (mu-crystallin family)
MPRVLILGHDQVRAALSPRDCAAAMTEILVARARGEAYMPLRTVSAPPGAKGFVGLMPGWRAGRAGVVEEFALKALCLIPDNPARGLDTHQGTVTLFDGTTGVPTAILDASAITEIRTAAVTAVATRALARAGARVLAILGAGVQGRSHLEALAPTRDYAEVRIYAPSADHAHAAAEHGATHYPGATRIAVASAAERAVRGADVVVTATSSREPVLRREWLSQGAHVNAVGASQPGIRELDVETVAAAALFCDSRESVRNEAGDFRLAVERGAITGEDHIRAELGEVLAGTRAGRTADTELTLFRSLGIAVEDLAAARAAVDSARRLGLGTEVEL